MLVNNESHFKNVLNDLLKNQSTDNLPVSVL